MYALERISTGQRLAAWSAVPGAFACDLGEVNGAGPGWSDGDFRIVAFTPAVTSEDVNRERDRRLQLFPFGGKQYDFNETSRIDIAGAGSLAQGAIIAGAQPGNLRWADDDTDFRWIAADNSSVTMDAQACFAFAQAAARWRADHIYAARALKDADPIPENYTDDSHWPQG
jgi:hypothetical protein